MTFNWVLGIEHEMRLRFKNNLKTISNNLNISIQKLKR